MATDDRAAADEKPRLLVVDDEESIVHATAMYFRAHGWTVEVAREREEAEALLSASRFTLVIADMRLTGVHGREGLELVGFVRERCPWTKIVVLTGYVSGELADEVRQRGADLFLEKPVPLSELVGVARRLVAAGAS
jgi:DNA-binding NtrC family response regulator